MKRSIIALVMGLYATFAWASEETELSKATAKAVNVAANTALDVKGKLSEYSAVLTELTKEYAPQAVDAVFWIVRLEAIQALVMSFVGFILLFLVWWLYFTKVWKWAETTYDKNFTKGIWALALGVPTLIIGVESGIRLFNIWNWVAIFEPKLFLAYKLFHKFL